MPNTARFSSQYNRTLNFLPYDSNNWYMKELPLAASLACEQGSFLYRVEDGTYGKVTNSTANNAAILASFDLAATDADYATSGKLRLCWLPKTVDAECYFTVGSGTFTAADVDVSVKFYDEKSVDVDTAGTQFLITKYLSSTRGVGRATLVVS